MAIGPGNGSGSIDYFFTTSFLTENGSVHSVGYNVFGSLGQNKETVTETHTIENILNLNDIKNIATSNSLVFALDKVETVETDLGTIRINITGIDFGKYWYIKEHINKEYYLSDIDLPIPIGTYTISFLDIPGYIKPNDVIAIIEKDETSIYTATFQKSSEQQSMYFYTGEPTPNIYFNKYETESLDNNLIPLLLNAKDVCPSIVNGNILFNRRTNILIVKNDNTICIIDSKERYFTFDSNIKQVESVQTEAYDYYSSFYILLENGQLYVYTYDIGSTSLLCGVSATKLEPKIVPFFQDNPVEKIAVGLSHILFLTKTGQIYALGNNEYGQCGNPNSSVIFIANTPYLLTYTNIANATNIWVGYNVSYCLVDGFVWSWGSNNYGLLGDGGNSNFNSEPRQMLYVENVKEVYSSQTQSATWILDEDNNLYACGASSSFLGINANNELINEPTHLAYLDEVEKILTPILDTVYIQIKDGLLVQIDNSDKLLKKALIPYKIDKIYKTNDTILIKRYTDILNLFGTLKIIIHDDEGLGKWYLNDDDSILYNSNDVVSVHALQVYTIKFIDVEGYKKPSSIKINETITGDYVINPDEEILINVNYTIQSESTELSGDIYLAGRSDYYYINTEYFVNNLMVHTILPDFNNAKKIFYHSKCCYVIDTNNTLWRWGTDYTTNNNTYTYNVPTIVMENVKDMSTSCREYPYTGLILTLDGDVYYWGRYAAYSGNGDSDNWDPVITPVKVQTLSDIKQVATVGYACFALTNSGELYVWGQDSNYGLFGLGNDSYDDYYTPVKVPGFNNIVQISVYGHYEYAVAGILLDNGDLYTTGDSWENGHGTGKDVYTKLLSNIKKIAFNGFEICLALTFDDEVWGWGYCTNNNNTKYPELHYTDVKDIAVGYHMSFLLLNNGNLYGFGTNDYYAMGIDASSLNSYTFILTPPSNTEILNMAMSNHNTALILGTLGPTGQVKITLIGANDEGKWFVKTQPDSKYNSDQIVTLPIGTYTISFIDISDWNKPSDISITVVETGIVEQTYMYIEKAKGDIIINIIGGEGLGQYYFITDPDVLYSTNTTHNLYGGTYEIEFIDVYIWQKPTRQTIVVFEDETTIYNFSYIVAPHGTLTINFVGGNNLAVWYISENKLKTYISNQSVKLLPGEYTIKYNIIDNWFEPEDTIVTIVDGSNIELTKEYKENLLYIAGTQFYNQFGIGFNSSSFSKITNWKPIHIYSKEIISLFYDNIKEIDTNYYGTFFRLKNNDIYYCGNGDFYAGYGYKGIVPDNDTYVNTPLKHPAIFIHSMDKIHMGKEIRVVYNENTVYVWGQTSGMYGGFGDSAYLGSGNGFQEVNRFWPCAWPHTFPVNIKQIVTSSEQYNYVILENDRIYAWGHYDCLGLSQSSGWTLVPTILPWVPPSPIKFFANGKDSRVVVLENNDVFVWGRNPLGELGVGYHNWNQTAPVSEPVPIKMSSRNPNFSSGFPSEIVQVAAGDNFFLYLLDTGELWGCGANNYGQLGDGTTTNKGTPVLIPFSFPSPIKKLKCAGSHTIVILNNGEVYGWGSNLFSQLGLSNTIPYTIPTKLDIPISNIIDVALNEYGSFFYGDTTSVNIEPVKNHHVYVAGNNTNNILGIGKDQVYSGTKTELIFSRTPKQISCKTNHTLVLLYDGTVLGWGSNEYGKLNKDPNLHTHIYEPTLLDTSNMEGNIIYVEAGFNNSFIITDLGYVYGCGLNDRYQLGTGTSSALSFVFQKVQTTQPFVSVKAGKQAVYALSPNNNIFGWGYCYTPASTYLSYIRNPTNLLKTLMNYSVGANHFLGIEQNYIYASGIGTNYVFGNNSTADIKRYITSLSINANKVCAHENLSLYLNANGEVFGCGLPGRYLGINTAAEVRTWTKINMPAGVIIKDMYLGTKHAAFISTTNQLYFAGLNNHSQFGASNTSGVFDISRQFVQNSETCWLPVYQSDYTNIIDIQLGNEQTNILQNNF